MMSLIDLCNAILGKAQQLPEPLRTYTARLRVWIAGVQGGALTRKLEVRLQQASELLREANSFLADFQTLVEACK